MSAALADAIAARSSLAQALAEKEAACQRGVADLALSAQRCSAFEAQVTRESTARSIPKTGLRPQKVLARTSTAARDRVTSLGTRLADIEAQFTPPRWPGAPRSRTGWRIPRLLINRQSSGRQRNWQMGPGEIAAFEARLSEETGARGALEERLAATAAALEQARRAWQSDSAGGRAARGSGVAAGGRRPGHGAPSGGSRGLRRQLDVMRTRADTLRRHAAQVPMLQVQLERSHKENRRQFERAPYGLCECSRDGSITRVNHSLAGLLGYRTARTAGRGRGGNGLRVSRRSAVAARARVANRQGGIARDHVQDARSPPAVRPPARAQPGRVGGDRGRRSDHAARGRTAAPRSPPPGSRRPGRIRGGGDLRHAASRRQPGRPAVARRASKATRGFGSRASCCSATSRARPGSCGSSSPTATSRSATSRR